MPWQQETLQWSIAFPAQPDRPGMANSRGERVRPGHIQFVIGSLSMGGAESQLVLLAERLKLRGWSTEVFLVEKSGALGERLRRAGIPVRSGGYDVRDGKARKIMRLALCEMRLVWHLARSRPDVVHGFLPISNIMAALAARLAFVPLVVTSKRALGRYQERDPKFRRLDRLSNALSHVITANSVAVARDMHERDDYDLSCIVVIPNGLDFSRFDGTPQLRNDIRGKLGLSHVDIAIVMVANLIPYKGHGELIAAFARVAADNPRLRLFLIGRDDGIGPGLVAEAQRLGIQDRISFMGERGDVPSLLPAMDIGVMASHEEGFSNALLEKLAAGLPVVATDVGGNPEALEGMPDCALVRPQDVDDLARGLQSIVARLATSGAGSALRQQIVRERYSVDVMVDAYEHLYTTARTGKVDGR
jgi:glycosyltransferase involved in cell wall biosynthesis